ncbi:hypothetical protein HDU76_001322 [Blyttiomyces sp. JEL0837]|nr:hypothetical protein HDU76_001322 [Blyttiomyces sp. JEL0837]
MNRFSLFVLIAVAIYLTFDVNKVVGDSVMIQRRASPQIPIQKIKLVSEISESGRAAIASSRTRELVKPDLNSHTNNAQPSHSNFFATLNAASPTSVNISDPQLGLAGPGAKLFYTKVPVTIGQSGNFSLVLSVSSVISTFVRGADCNSGPSCNGPKLKSSDPDVSLNSDSIAIAFQFVGASGPGATTTAFGIGGLHNQRQTFEFCSFNTAYNMTTNDFGDGIFSLSNNANFNVLVYKQLSWLITTFPVDQQIAGLYLPFIDRPNDHGELTLGGFDSSKFTGGITYCSNATFTTAANANGIALYAEPLDDVISMNDACFDLVTKTLNVVQDPKTLYLIVDCGLLKTGPDLKLAFGGHVFTLGPESYIYHDTSSGVCVLLVANTPGALILGTPFLINYYSIYDSSNQRFGFAKAVHPKYYSRQTTTTRSAN